MLKITKGLIKQIALFGIVGVATLLVDLAVTTVLYESLNFPAYLASAIGFLSGFFVNFPLNRKKVFQHSESDRYSLRSQVVLYFALCIFNLMATSLLTELLVSGGGMRIVYAKALVTALIAVWNFILFKAVIFSKQPHADKSGLDERLLNDIL